MITIHFSADDMSKLRFSYRPLLEIPLSYRVLVNAEFHTSYLKWVEEAKRALYDVDLPYMHALMSERFYIPLFLAESMDNMHFDMNAQIDTIQAIPKTVIQENILELINLYGDSEIRRHFLTYPSEAIQRLAGEMRLYWKRTLARYQTHLTSTLEGDILYHARMLALDGPGKLLEDLHSSISVKDNRIDIKRPVTELYHLDGRGLQLVPVIFKSQEFGYHISPDSLPLIAYGVHGTGLWYRKTMPSKNALELTLGAGRARLLVALTTPKTNGELTRLLHVTTGAVSQQVARLSQAGLVEHLRIDKRVYYRLTQRGEELLRLFERMT